VPEPRPSRAAKAGLLVLAVAALFLLFRFLPVALWIETFAAHVRGRGPFGVAIFGLAYVAVSLVPGGPAALMTLAAGAVYGLPGGTLLVSAASTTAATLAFLLARGVLAGRVRKMAEGNAAFEILTRAIGKDGARIVALVRLSPAFPFTVVNYLFGLTPVRLSSYVLASWLAMLPGTLAYVYFGSALGGAAGEGAARAKAVRIGLGAAAVVATLLVARFAARAIRRAGIVGAAGDGATSASRSRR